jgi:hypothetical protein
MERLRSELAALDLRRASVEADNLALQEAARLADESAAAARALVVELRQSFEGDLAALASVRSALVEAERWADELQRHIDAMEATKLMRATRGLRKVYGALHRGS